MALSLNLHLLRLFAAVAEAGTFSKAARTLYISQPAVSKGVRELESQLGLVLIERGRKRGERPAGESGIRLTEAGASLLAHARGIFAMEAAALEDVRARLSIERGTLTIGASTSVAGHLLPPYLASFSSAHPTIALKVVVGNTRWVCEQLGHCSIDLAIVEGAVSDHRIELTHWSDDPLVIVAPPNSDLARGKVEPSRLSRQRWILREPGSGTREATEALCRANGIQATAWMELASNDAIARTVASGVGIAMLPRAVVVELLALGTLKQVNFPATTPLSRPLYLASLRARPLPPAAAAMAALLAART